MKLEQIEQILSLADTGSFTETARRLYISQPNLSASVKQLENEIGNIIFERTPSGLVVTPFGLEYLHHLRAVKRELDATEAFLGQAPHRIRLSLNIATTKCIWINDFFSGIINHYDGNQLNFSLYNTENSDAAMDLVHTSACDLAFVSLTGPEQQELVRRSRSMGLEYHKLYASPMHIMLGRKNPLYHQEGTFPLKELSKYPYVSYGTSRQLATTHALKLLGISPHLHSIIRVNTNNALYNVVENTKAFTISANTPGKHSYRHVRAIPLDGLPFFIEVGWLKLRRTDLTTTALSFLHHVTEALADRQPPS